MGAALGSLLISAFVIVKDAEFVFLIAVGGIVTFFLGLGFLLNGVLLTVPKKGLPDKSSDAQRQRELDGGKIQTSDLALPESPSVFSSVTENTTRHLKEKDPVGRD
jgi:hypothetical protein